jgi:hypothetical protein
VDWFGVALVPGVSVLEQPATARTRAAVIVRVVMFMVVIH